MRRQTLLVILVVAIFVQGAYSDACFVKSDGDLKLAEGCKEGKATLLLKADTLTFEVARTGSKEVNPDLGLKVGRCEVGGTLTTTSGAGSLQIEDVGALKLPITATVTKSEVKFAGVPIGQPLPLKCSPVFKKVDGGFIIDVEYSLSEVVSGLTITFKNVTDYSSAAKEGAWKWPLIIVLGVIGILGAVTVLLFLLFRWHKARKLKRAQEEAALKKPTEKKPVETKPAIDKPAIDKPIIETPKPVAKKEETKPKETQMAVKAPKAQKKSEEPRTAKDTPFKKQVVKDTPFKKQAAKNTPSKKQVDKDTPSKKQAAKKHKFDSTESDLKTPNFETKHVDRLDIREVTARDEKATTEATSCVTSEATTEASFELTPYKISDKIARFLGSKKHVKELLNLIGPQQRHQLYFNNISVEVYDVCNEVLKEIEIAVEGGASKDKEVAELRDQILMLKDLAKDVQIFTSNGKQKAHLPWSFKTALDFGYLTDQQIDGGFDLDAPTERQLKYLTVGLQDLRNQYSQMPSTDPAEAKLGALIKQIERLEELCRTQLRKSEQAGSDLVQQLIDRGELFE